MTTASPHETTAPAQNTIRPVIELCRQGPYWCWAVATTLLRLPPIMAPMALVLASMHYNGGPGLGGMLVGVSLVPSVLSAPVFGRLLDRLGPEVWTFRLLLFGAAARVALAPAFALGAPTWLLILLTLVGQVMTFGTGGATRALLDRVVPQRLISPALSIDSVLIEIVVVTAPFLVVLTSLASPAYALLAMGLSMAAGAVLLHPKALLRRSSESASDRTTSGEDLTQEGTDSAVTTPPEPNGVWRNPRFLFWALVSFSFGHLIGTADLGVLPRAVQQGGGTAQAAVLTAVLGFASAGAGLLYAWYGPRIKTSAVTQAFVLLLLMTASSVAFANAGSWWALGLAFAVLGLGTAPLNTVMFAAPPGIVRAERTSEAFSVLVAANGVGMALAGALLGAIPLHTMLLLGSGSALVTLLVGPILLRRGARTTRMHPPSPNSPGRATSPRRASSQGEK
ncbi:MFS transporter [Streptomyces sp. NBC_01217]|uniref:MFS transporter n=1 Tax=Streptomyces sp. NBC_01217 TaxID=2903779 RepID=UPI002E0ECA00|nr:MFS transporter [Streptomyces sp. NBC_01217]